MNTPTFWWVHQNELLEEQPPNDDEQLYVRVAAAPVVPEPGDLLARIEDLLAELDAMRPAGWLRSDGRARLLATAITQLQTGHLWLREAFKDAPS